MRYQVRQFARAWDEAYSAALALAKATGQVAFVVDEFAAEGMPVEIMIKPDGTMQAIRTKAKVA